MSLTYGQLWAIYLVLWIQTAEQIPRRMDKAWDKHTYFTRKSKKKNEPAPLKKPLYTI